MLQQSGEEWCSSLRKRVQSEFEQQKEELARFAADAKAKADRFDGQAIKLSAQLEEASHARESLQSMVGSLVEAANQRLQEVATTSLQHLRNRSEAEAARMSDQAGQHRAYMQELLQQNQTISQSIDLSAQQLKDTTATEMRGLSEQLCNTMRERLQTEFDHQAQRLSQATADAKSETARLEGQTSQLLERWKTIVEAHIQTAIDEVLAHTQQRLERVSSSAVEQQLARVQQQIEHSLDPLLARAHSATSGLETVLASIESERQQAEHARSDAQQQFGKAQTWLTEETARFRESVHDALLEASGEIKGRIHMAVEMTKEPIERRGRDVQLQIEEMAARKSREFAQHFVEIEKALEPLLQQRLAQSLEQFREGSQELAQTSMNQYQKELDETLDAMLRLLRSKRSPSS